MIKYKYNLVRKSMKLSFFIIIVSLSINYLLANSPQTTDSIEWKLNTSNLGKLNEFQKLFAKYDIRLIDSQFDLDEVDADPMTVIAHKASQLGEFILVEDTSLDIEGADVGVNVRWLIDHLNEYIGRKAVWMVLLAYRIDNQIFIFKGEVLGIIVSPQGEKGFGFDPVFLPVGSDLTLAQSKPDEFNARALAVDALVNNENCQVVDAIYEWDGPWQSHE